MAGHAPEPWYWDQADDIDDGFVIYFGPDYEHGGPVPVQRKIEWKHGLDPDEHPEQFEEAAATADLICAAPKFLAACKRLAESKDQKTGAEVWIKVSEAYDLAVAAIAEYEGQQGGEGE